MAWPRYSVQIYRKPVEAATSVLIHRRKSEEQGSRGVGRGSFKESLFGIGVKSLIRTPMLPCPTYSLSSNEPSPHSISLCTLPMDWVQMK
jgi:hypothetical protein